MTDRSNLRKSMDTLFPQERRDRCRVCKEPVVDGRWNYCSKRCKRIARAVQKMFVWDVIREQILERDDYTCQMCGLSKERWREAYWRARDLIDEKNPYDAQDEYDGYSETRDNLREIYGVESVNGGFHVDHITPVSEGGHPFDESNLQTLCKFCHREKTAEENSGERRPADELTLDDYLAADGGETSGNESTDTERQGGDA
ncbi:HNH endonuclease [Halosimplex pelagicum]|uniref:HNH endonuclease n=2 Tax=Halosimplex pelagicum TaxID=869886 RepID=A0A7D5TET5_9EURY|nr:HNH endonuclease [Halosimplex pelagicum]QLH84989.1 HNH endonuclease [Halosimplex pelagicum]